MVLLMILCFSCEVEEVSVQAMAPAMAAWRAISPSAVPVVHFRMCFQLGNHWVAPDPVTVPRISLHLEFL